MLPYRSTEVSTQVSTHNLVGCTALDIRWNDKGPSRSSNRAVRAKPQSPLWMGSIGLDLSSRRVTKTICGDVLLRVTRVAAPQLSSLSPMIPQPRPDRKLRPLRFQRVSTCFNYDLPSGGKGEEPELERPHLGCEIWRSSFHLEAIHPRRSPLGTSAELLPRPTTWRQNCRSPFLYSVALLETPWHVNSLADFGISATLSIRRTHRCSRHIAWKCRVAHSGCQTLSIQISWHKSWQDLSKSMGDGHRRSWYLQPCPGPTNHF